MHHIIFYFLDYLIKMAAGVTKRVSTWLGCRVTLASSALRYNYVLTKSASMSSMHGPLKRVSLRVLCLCDYYLSQLSCYLGEAGLV